MENNGIAMSKEAVDFDKIIKKLLENRGINTAEKEEAFLYPSISNLSDLTNYVGLNDVAKRIEKSIAEKEKVVIYGDYDCDGVCATAILYLFLKENGVEVNYYIPNRHSEGYGLNIEALEKIAEEYCPDLVVSVDCGISSKEEVEYVYEVLGFDIVITDHHDLPVDLPQCLIFNPKLSVENAFRDLCGAGVVLRIVEKIAGREYSKKFFDIACIATVADVVPLLEDNRIIVFFGLKSINAGLRKGIKMLCESCLKTEVKSSDIAFRIAPRINSLGRIGDATKAVELFVESDHFLLKCLIDEINKANDTRQQLTKDLLEHCEELLIKYDFEKYPIIVLFYPYWDDGIIGIVASQLVGKFGRPAILLTENNGKTKGSGRSIKGVDILKCVTYCKNLLEKFGGHKMACGLNLETKNVDVFRESINNFAKAIYTNDVFLPLSKADVEIEGDIDLTSAKQLRMFEPFGERNPQPIFSKKVFEMNFDKIGSSTHIKCKEKNNEYIYFGGLNNLSLLENSLGKNIDFTINTQIYQNIESVSLNILGLSSEEKDECLEENFFSQVVYPDKSIFKISEITMEEAFSIGNDSLYSHCFVCYNIETFETFKKKYKGKIICMCNQILKEKTPYNTLVFDIRIDSDLQFFDKIIFLDKPLRKGFLDELRLKRDAQIFFVNDSNNKKQFDNLLLSYVQMGQLFVVMKEILSIKSAFTLTKLYYQVSKKIKFPLTNKQFFAAFYIFVDLGIVNVEKDGIIITKVQNPLGNSSLYKMLLEANNG